MFLVPRTRRARVQDDLERCRSSVSGAYAGKGPGAGVEYVQFLGFGDSEFLVRSAYCAAGAAWGAGYADDAYDECYEYGSAAVERGGWIAYEYGGFA